MRPILILFIDALNINFINKKHTPFLYSLLENTPHTLLRPILGYSDSIKATLYTGCFPDVHNYWIMYKYNPGNSPFLVYNNFRHIDYLPINIEHGIKFFLPKFTNLFFNRNNKLRDLNPKNIPYKFVHNFDMTLDRHMLDNHPFNIPTIFDVMNENGINYSYTDSSVVNLLKDINTINSETVLSWIYIHYLDYAAHRYGIESKQFIKTLCETDKLLQFLVYKINNIHKDKILTLLFSDHGMTTPKITINLSKLINHPKHGSEYLLFLDSTMVHIWYINPKIKNNLLNIFNKLNIGKILTVKDKVELNIHTKKRWYGDDVFLLRPNYQIYPNYISMLKPKSMHAYHPKHQHQKGIFVAPFLNTKKESTLPDITAALYAILNIEKPSYVDGTTSAK